MPLRIGLILHHQDPKYGLEFWELLYNYRRYSHNFKYYHDDTVEQLIASCIKQLEENRREIQAQDVLNKAKHPHGCTTPPTK